MKDTTRKTAGRKPSTDKKKQLYTFIEQSKIDLLGGDDEVKYLQTMAVDEAIKKLLR